MPQILVSWRLIDGREQLARKAIEAMNAIYGWSAGRRYALSAGGARFIFTLPLVGATIQDGAGLPHDHQHAEGAV